MNSVLPIVRFVSDLAVGAVLPLVVLISNSPGERR
jgi:hypothetical protein